MERKPSPLGNFKPSLAFLIGVVGNGNIYAFVSQKQKDKTSALFEREYHSLRFMNGYNKTENFTQKSNAFMYGKVPNSSEGKNRLFGICGPVLYKIGTSYSIFRSIGEKIEYCLQISNPPNGSLSLDAVSADN